MDRQNSIIQELVSDLKTFSPVRPSFQVAVMWSLISLIITVMVTLWVAPFRGGVHIQLLEFPRFSLEVVVGVLIAFFVAWNVLALSTPGRDTRKIMLGAASLLILFGLLLGYSFLEPATSVSMNGKRPFCFYEGLVYGSALAISLLFLARQRAPFSRVALGVLCGISAVSMTAVVMHLACMYDPQHILSHHISPVFALAGLGAIAAPLMIRKL